MARWLEPLTDLEVRGSSLACHVVSSDKEFTPLSLSSPRCINGYRRHTSCWGGNPVID